MFSLVWRELIEVEVWLITRCTRLKARDMSGEEDEVPRLSAETLAVLQEFYKEQEEREQLLHQVIQNKESSNVVISENWQLSQFWYDEKTALALSKEIVRAARENGKIALVSCPSIHPHIKNIISDKHEVVLFEFDNRFSIYGENFVKYDYKVPLNVPQKFASYFDVVIADPPFLSEECLSKVSITIKYLAKDKIILCTGAVMEDAVTRFLNLKKCNFVPHHQNNLGNEFSCYANYTLDESISN